VCFSAKTVTSVHIAVFSYPQTSHTQIYRLVKNIYITAHCADKTKNLFFYTGTRSPYVNCMVWLVLYSRWVGKRWSSSNLIVLTVFYIYWHYSPTGRRNHGKPLKRLLDTWDRKGWTSGPTPWHILSSSSSSSSIYLSVMMMIMTHKVKILHLSSSSTTNCSTSFHSTQTSYTINQQSLYYTAIKSVL
jgi:hypothetical protein